MELKPQERSQSRLMRAHGALLTQKVHGVGTELWARRVSNDWAHPKTGGRNAWGSQNKVQEDLATSRYLPWPHTLPWEGQGTAGKEARELANGRPWWEALA